MLAPKLLLELQPHPFGEFLQKDVRASGDVKKNQITTVLTLLIALLSLMIESKQSEETVLGKKTEDNLCCNKVE